MKSFMEQLREPHLGPRRALRGAVDMDITHEVSPVPRTGVTKVSLIAQAGAVAYVRDDVPKEHEYVLRGLQEHLAEVVYGEVRAAVRDCWPIIAELKYECRDVGQWDRIRHIEKQLAHINEITRP